MIDAIGGRRVIKVARWTGSEAVLGTLVVQQLNVAADQHIYDEFHSKFPCNTIKINGGVVTSIITPPRH